jgi:two-component system sensor histidine kinase KdpD
MRQAALGVDEEGTMSNEPMQSEPGALPAPGEAADPPASGRLRIYLGAAPGVGKTYTMLQEGRRRKASGTDVVVGFVETHGRPQTADLLGGLEVVPSREVPYRGVVVRELDTELVIARQPEVALVDELAHTNVSASRHPKRYEDVRDLLAAGIDVISTLNIQHIESLSDTVRQLTGVNVQETVPDRVVEEADQIELIDMAPEELIQRMQDGDIYPPEQAMRALEHFFTQGNLTALRNLALRVTATDVQSDLTRLMLAQPDQGTVAAVTMERVMVAVDHRSIGKALIRRGWRIAAALKTELLVVHVELDRGGRAPQNLIDERRLRTHLQLADDLGAQVIRLRGNIADELIACVRARNATLLVIGQSRRSRRDELLHGSLTHDLLRRARGFDVLVVGEPAQPSRQEEE